MTDYRDEFEIEYESEEEMTSVQAYIMCAFLEGVLGKPINKKESFLIIYEHLHNNGGLTEKDAWALGQELRFVNSSDPFMSNFQDKKYGGSGKTH